MDERMEPNVNKGANINYTLLSIAISLKRIADVEAPNGYGFDYDQR